MSTSPAEFGAVVADVCHADEFGLLDKACAHAVNDGFIRGYVDGFSAGVELVWRDVDAAAARVVEAVTGDRPGGQGCRRGTRTPSAAPPTTCGVTPRRPGNGRSSRSGPPCPAPGSEDIVTTAQLDAGEHVLPGPAEETPVQRADRARRLFPRIDWHELWADVTDEDRILEPVLPARRLVSIYSAPKLGKSLLMLEVAAAVSRGETVLGATPDRRFRVLYVDFENDPRGDVRQRLQAMGYGPDDLDHLDYLSFPTMGALDSERGGVELLEAVNAYGSELVVIDTVSRAVAGEENSNDTWLGFYRHTGLRLKQAGVTLVRLDHSGKDESKGQRGGSAKSGDVDAVWRLTKETGTRFRLECTEARFQIDTKVLHLTRHALPRLHHAVDATSAVLDRDAKVSYLVELADSLHLPRDAGRDDIRAAAKPRGISARNDVLADVVRARKAVPDPWGQPDHRGQENGEKTSRDSLDGETHAPMSEALLPVPDPPGQPGTAGLSLCVPVPLLWRGTGDRPGSATADSPSPNCAPPTARPTASTANGR